MGQATLFIPVSSAETRVRVALPSGCRRGGQSRRACTAVSARVPELSLTGLSWVPWRALSHSGQGVSQWAMPGSQDSPKMERGVGSTGNPTNILGVEEGGFPKGVTPNDTRQSRTSRELSQKWKWSLAGHDARCGL